MTDKEYEEQQARVQGLIDKWVTPLFRCWWHIDVEWNRGCYEDAPRTVGRCTVQWEYLRATIAVFLPEVQKLSDEALEWLWVHECMHVYLNELRPMAGDDHVSASDWLDHEERVCTLLAKAFCCVRDYAKEGKL